MSMVTLPIISFIITLIATPLIAKFNKKQGLFGIDVHKIKKYEVPEAGGLALLIGTVPIFVFYYLLVGDTSILMFIFPIIVIGLIGFLDDLYNISQLLKLILCFLGGLPLLFFINSTSLNLLIFRIDLGTLYFLVVPIGIAAASNLTNLLAGFNGEEVGLGVISTLSLSICILILGDIKTSIYLLTFTVSLIAFLLYNKYPARIFPGDTGTLMIGATIASFSIIKNIEIIGALILFPQILEFFFKSIRKFKGKKFGPTKVDNEGFLHPPEYTSIANLLTSNFKLKEKGLVFVIWGIGAIFGIISILLTYFGLVG